MKIPLAKSERYGNKWRSKDVIADDKQIPFGPASMLLFHEALSKVVIEFVLYGRILVCLFVCFFFMSSLTAVDETGKEKNSY